VLRAEFVGGATASEFIRGAAVLEVAHDDDLTTYWCRTTLDNHGRVAGFRLTQFGTGAAFGVVWTPATFAPQGCTCGRPACRHAQALRLALAGLARHRQAATSGSLLLEGCWGVNDE
jgi:hypothetical protein